MLDRRFHRRDHWDETDISLKCGRKDQFLNVRGDLIQISVNKRMRMHWPIKVLEHVFLRKGFQTDARLMALSASRVLILKAPANHKVTSKSF